MPSLPIVDITALQASRGSAPPAEIIDAQGGYMDETWLHGRDTAAP